MGDIVYVTGGDGQMYAEMRDSSGGCEYVPAEPGLKFQEVTDRNGRGTGRFLVMRDAEVHAQQREMTSHETHIAKTKSKMRSHLRPEDLEGLKPEEENVVRQRMRRLDVFEQQFQQVAIDRVSPGASPQIKTITDADFMRRRDEWVEMQKKGEEKHCDFQPLTAYARKLVTHSGKVIRPLFKGEVGMLQDGTILVLEQGYGTGNLVAVPESFGSGEKTE